MKKTLLALAALGSLAAAQPAAAQTREMKIYDQAVFYDGYNGTVFDAGLDDGILRHANHLYSRRLADNELDWMGSDLLMKVTIGALCDNYDRIGNINLALVPKGQDTYVPEEVQRIELARFITPFMNKNAAFSKVPYEYEDNSMALIFRDANIRAEYDYWLEFELFGVPYAANEQVAGCAGRNDVFKGTLEFKSNTDPAPAVTEHRLVPIVIKRPESKGHNLNNYSEQGTDTLGTCTKTYRFNVADPLADSRLTLITSNHGANQNGEEYVRRKHLVYVDGELALVYTPGGVSCEPYRKYNTQGNGIYGSGKKSDAWWASWNNWCPGAAIPTRTLSLGQLPAGDHEVMIRVPDAEFAGAQGDFPVSMYLQGMTQGSLPAGLDAIVLQNTDMQLHLSDGLLSVTGTEPADEIEIYSLDGRLCYGTRRTSAPLSLARLGKGTFIAVATARNGATVFRKFTL